MRYKECYMELKNAMKLLEKNHAFEQFNHMNLFYLLDESSKGIVILSDHIVGESVGLHIYLGSNGINYLYDSYMSPTGLTLNAVFADMVTIAFVSKNDLTERDINFLKKYKIRISKEHNLIPWEFKEGHIYSYLSLKKMRHVIAYLYYLLSLIKNEHDDILKCFEDTELVLAAFDTTLNLYEVRYTGDIILGDMPRTKKINQAFVDEYKDSIYIEDTCYISRYYSFKTVGENEYYQSVLFGYYMNKNTHLLHIISCKPNQIKEYLTGFVDELFKDNGIPTKVVFNERRLYAELYKTLKSLHIDVTFQRETEAVDSLFYDLLDDSKETLEEGGKKLKMAYVS
ncbi:MAG: hypothetical protein NC310_07280 [Roseburia sp.]|nr:hypothetical protein [Anaeroplasma bactoclasticum]MCM1196851.1 hypothetical protein [Roseburia sp.]MCM1557020.1 hypothetical protein [Anaeroplasma bactoclasticum]